MQGHRRSDPSFAGPRSRSIIARIEDDLSGGTRFETDDAMDRADLEPALDANKLSRELLGDECGEGARTDADHRKARRERLERVTEALVAADVSFAAIKNLKAPYAMMSDVDLLVPDPGDHAVAARVLAERDYEFYRFRLLAHPRKMMAKRSARDPRPVDIYPDAMWIRKVVCDPESVVVRAESAPPREPSPADDLYLVATHAYSHLSVTLAELVHGVAVVEGSDVEWSRLVEQADQYGCRDALLAYVYPLDWYLRASGREPIPEDVVEALETGPVAGAVRRWWDGLEPPVEFPVQFPLHLPTVLSAAHHLPRIARTRSLRTAYKDLQSHALTLGSMLVRGEA
ncbi:nucleotidyltransferase family protein [Haloplanus pelagicus]|uniref:nucleotidyltransferase family protein n=1 Tax=Haloplanus pelagicus TaxID=2949995 RepID=UPI00203B85AF|nr:nucleotidyltransferase family protein [Haloplanus sp. HW8-1]